MDNQKKVLFGQCVGVPGRVVAHIFFDGKAHYQNSHGLCPTCRDMMLSQLEARRYRTEKAMLTDAARVVLSP